MHEKDLLSFRECIVQLQLCVFLLSEHASFAYVHL